jgi:hypothetical protein
MHNAHPCAHGTLNYRGSSANGQHYIQRLCERGFIAVLWVGLSVTLG